MMIISVNRYLYWRARTALTDFPVTIACVLVSLMIENKAMDLNAVSFYQGGSSDEKCYDGTFVAKYINSVPVVRRTEDQQQIRSLKETPISR